MNQSLNLSDHFQNTKYEILKQKYEYMTIYLSETEKRVAELKHRNKQYRNKLDSLEANSFNSREDHAELQNCWAACQSEEKEKGKKIDELKKLISEYKFLCQEAVKYKAPQASRSFFSK